MKLTKIAAFAAFALVSIAASAQQTVKIGFITSYSGLNGNLGPYMERAVRLYLKQHEKELGGVKVSCSRATTPAQPDKARQLAQELVVRDKVNLLAGVIFTPNAMAMAPIATEAKVPFIIMNAGTSVITTRSPYMVRTSFTLWQSSYPLGQWASKKFKTAYSLVSDFGPGHDAEEAFAKAFEEGGGKLLAKYACPCRTRTGGVHAARQGRQARHADGLHPGGKTATAVMKNFSDLGLGQAGIKLIGPGDITTDEELPNMGDVALGVLTVHHYSAGATRASNKAFVEAWKKEYGQNETPNFVAVGAYDGAALIVEAIKQQRASSIPTRRWRSSRTGRAEQPARADLDRPRDARHRPERVPARGEAGRRPARQRRARDRRHGSERPLERVPEEKVVFWQSCSRLS